MRYVLPMIAALSAMPLPAPAAGPAVPPAVFSVHDLNRDGYLGRDEYAALQAHCRQRGCCDPGRLLDFAVLDSDGDGRIGEEELLEHLGRRPSRGGRYAP